MIPNVESSGAQRSGAVPIAKGGIAKGCVPVWPRGCVPGRYLWLLGVSLFCTGCFGQTLNAKRWGDRQFGNSDIPTQSERSKYFDPYPLNDIGPEVVGARPREFMSPLPEANRNELNRQIPASFRR
jgi:hypothetical protein